MKDLLSAGFARLWKSPVFWVLEGAAALFAAVVYGLALVNAHHFGPAWAAERANANFFVEMMYLGPALAIFAGFYTGVEHSDGTIRNKLSAGHLRRNVYLANLLVCAAVGMAAMALGSVLGNRIFQKVNERFILLSIYAMMAVSGVVMLFT